MMGICSIQRQYLSRIGACILDTDLVLLVLLGLVGESKFERLPHVEIGHVGIVFGVVVDFATELLLLLAGWDTSIGHIAFHSGVGLLDMAFRNVEHPDPGLIHSVSTRRAYCLEYCLPSQNKHHLTVFDYT